MQGLYGESAVNLREFMGTNECFRTPQFNLPDLASCQASVDCSVECPTAYTYPQATPRMKPQYSVRAPTSIPPYSTELTSGFCFDSAVISRNFGCPGPLSLSGAMPMCESAQIPFPNDPLISPDNTAVTTTVGKIRARRRTKSSAFSKEDTAIKSQESPLSLSTKSKLGSPEEELKTAVSPCSSTEVNSNTKDDRYLQRRLRNNLAAKRSRDNRKRREDTIAMRASYLEKSNLVLQAQILALKREICMLRGIPFDPNYRTRVPEAQITPDAMSSNFFPTDMLNTSTSALTPSSCNVESAIVPPTAFTNDLFLENSVLGQK